MSDLPAGDDTVLQVVDHADEMSLVLPGAEFGMSMISDGTDLTTVRSRFHGPVSQHVLDIGFPVLGGGACDRSALYLATVGRRGPKPTIWDGVESGPGQLYVYGPGSTHHCVNAEGARHYDVCVDYTSLCETADVLGVDIGDWEDRRVVQDRPRWQASSILAVGSELDPDGDGSALLSSVALALSSDSFDRAPTRMLSSKEIVGRSFESLDVTGSWFPAIADLCRSVGASERRLRQAFVDCFDRPPSEVLRTRALSAVRHVLQQSSPQDAEVSAVAASHGFRHLGDFARYYRAAFGETPSQTLRTTA